MKKLVKKIYHNPALPKAINDQVMEQIDNWGRWETIKAFCVLVIFDTLILKKYEFSK